MSPEEKLWIRTQQHIINDVYLRNKGVFTWEEFFKDMPRADYPTKPRKWIYLRILRFIFREYWSLIIHDVIYENVEFVFYKFGGKTPFMSLRIVDRDRRSKKWAYRPGKRGHDYIFWINNFYSLMSSTRKLYIFNASKRTRKALRDEVNKGHDYESCPEIKIPTYGFQKFKIHKSLRDLRYARKASEGDE